MKSPLFPISMAFLVGVIVASILPSNPITFHTAFIAALITILLFFVFFQNRIISNTFLYVLIFLSGLIRFATFNELPNNHIKFIVTEEPKRMFLKGVISSDPIFRRKFGYYPELEFLLKLDAIDKGSKWINASGLVLVKSYFSGEEVFKYGDILFIEGEIMIPQVSKTKGKFDYRAYLAGRKIYAICKIKKGTFIEKIGRLKSPIVSIKRFLYAIKKRARDSILINLAPPHSAILVAMLLGDRQYLNKTIKDIFIKTGTIHILAISGLHVGIIVFVFLGLFKFIRIPKKLMYIFTIILIFLYAIMIGQRPSVWRATIMAQVFLLGFILNRQPNLLNILSLALLILILAIPNYIFDIGFILSFVCVASIIWISPILDSLCKLNTYDLSRQKRDPVEFHLEKYHTGKLKTRKKIITFYLLKSLSISTSVWIGVAPIVAYYFHIITPIIILANLIAIPTCFVLVSLGLVALIFDLFLSSLSIIFYESIWLTNNIMLLTLKFLSNLPGSFVRIKSFPFFYIFIYYALLVYLIKNVRKKIVTFL